jgi:hypothetical protein
MVGPPSISDAFRAKSSVAGPRRAGQHAHCCCYCCCYCYYLCYWPKGPYHLERKPTNSYENFVYAVVIIRLLALKQGPNLGYRPKNRVIVRLYGPKTGSKLGLFGPKRCQSCQIHQNYAGQHAHCCCYRVAATALNTLNSLARYNKSNQSLKKINQNGVVWP